MAEYSIYKSLHTGQQIDDALSVAANAKLVNGILKGNGAGTFTAQAVDNTPTNGSTNLVESNGVYDALSTKVDAVTGKGLSSNDFTDALKTKLEGITDATTAVKGLVQLQDSLSNSTTTAVTPNAVKQALESEVSALEDLVLGLYPQKNLASAAVQSFSDGADGIPVAAMSVDVTAVQSGSGDPYPGGGGKNKLPNVATSRTVNGITFTVKADGTITVSGTASANTDLTIASGVTTDFNGMTLTGCPSGGGGSAYFLRITNGQTALDDTGSGRAINISDVGNGYTVYIRIANGYAISGTITFSPMVSVSGGDYAPYSNIRPISGWTGANIVSGSKNLFYPWEHKGFASDGSTPDNSNYWLSPFIPVSGSFVCSAASIAEDWRIGCYDANHNFVQRKALQSNPYVVSHTGYIRVCVPVAATDVQVEYGSTATAYKAASALNLTWQDDAGTIYGGTLVDNLDGTWTLTKTHASADLGDLSWTASSDGGGVFFRADISGAKLPASASVLPNAICSMFAPAPFNNLGNGQFAISNSVSRVYARDLDYTTAAAFTTAVTGQTLVYELATPTEYTLTADSVRTLLGNNVVFADTGNIEMTYRQDLITAINAIVNP